MEYHRSVGSMYSVERVSMCARTFVNVDAVVVAVECATLSSNANVLMNYTELFIRAYCL